MFWPYILLISTFLFWAALIVLLTKWPHQNNMSISRHAAASRATYIFFTPVQIAMGLISVIFVAIWFIPEYKLGWFFTLAYITTTFLQLSSALIEDRVNGFKSKLHLAMANLMAISMYLSVFALCLTQQFSDISRLFFWLTFAYMTVAIIFISSKAGKPERLKNYLFIQIFYFLSLQISVLVATFLK